MRRMIVRTASTGPFRFFSFSFFAAAKRDVFSKLVKADEIEAESCLRCPQLRVGADQWLADEPRYERAEKRVTDRRPDHVARDVDLLALNDESNLRRQLPEHADESEEHERRLNEADGKVHRQFRKAPRIFLDALVWIDAYFAGERKEESARWLQPLVEKVKSGGLAKPDLQPLMQPRLQDAQAKENADDRQKHTYLVHKHGNIALADGVIDAALPVVEPHLGDCVCAYDERNKNKILRNAVL